MLACELAAIGEGRLGRYRQLRSRLEAAVEDRRETATGYEWTLNETRMTPEEAAEWMSLERRCCPFLELSLEMKGGQCRLRLAGPESVKEILAAEFSAAQAADAGRTPAAKAEAQE